MTLNVIEGGPADGPPIILLHGFPESGRTWGPVLAPLAARGFRVIAPDMRGYANSDAPAGLAPYALPLLAEDVVALADACGLDRFDLVGHDWGGVVAWAVAGWYGDRLNRLVVLAAPHPDIMAGVIRRHPSQLLRSLYVGFFQLPRLPEAMLRARRFHRLRRALVRSARPGTFSPAALDRYAADWNERLTPMLNYYRALRLARPKVGRITVPTHILWGAQDRFLSAPLAFASAAMCRDAAVELRVDATHWLHLEQPGWVADRIADLAV